MESEHERIDRLEAEGKISAEEADSLRSTLRRAEAKDTAAGEHPVAGPRLSRLAVAGALGFPAAIAMAVVVYAFGIILSPHPGDDRALVAALLVGMVVLMTGVGLSIAGLVAIRREPDRLRGARLAKVAIWAPLLFLAALFTASTVMYFVAVGRTQEQVLRDEKKAFKALAEAERRAEAARREAEREKEPTKRHPFWLARQEKGSVRVSLLVFVRGRAGEELGTTGMVDENTQVLKMAYVVEFLGDEPVRHTNSGPTEWLTDKGQHVVGRQDGLQKASGYEKFEEVTAIPLAGVENPGRSVVRTVTGVAQVQTAKTYDITLHEGFNDKKEEFRFLGVPAIEEAEPQQLRKGLDIDRYAIFTVVQRKSKDLPGSRAFFKVCLQDITAGQVLLSIRSADGLTWLDTTSVRKGDKLLIVAIGMEHYRLILLDLVNVLVGDDFARFIIVSPEWLPEWRKINALLASIEKKGAVLLCDGAEHTGAEARRYLLKSLEHAVPQPASFLAFIKLASQAPGGGPCRIREAGAEAMDAEQWFLREAERLGLAVQRSAGGPVTARDWLKEQAARLASE